MTTKWAAIKKNSQPTATQIGKDRTTHLVDGPLSHILSGQLHYNDILPYFSSAFAIHEGLMPE